MSDPVMIPAPGDALRKTLCLDGCSWMVIRKRESDGPEVYPFADEETARAFHDKAQQQWSDCYLARVVMHGMQQPTPAPGDAETLKAGDPVWYRHHQRGGYCLGSDVPAEFVRATARRVIVLAFLKSGAKTRVVVKPESVRRRDPAAVWK